MTSGSSCLALLSSHFRSSFSDENTCLNCAYNLKGGNLWAKNSDSDELWFEVCWLSFGQFRLERQESTISQLFWASPDKTAVQRMWRSTVRLTPGNGFALSWTNWNLKLITWLFPADDNSAWLWSDPIGLQRLFVWKVIFRYFGPDCFNIINNWGILLRTSSYNLSQNGEDTGLKYFRLFCKINLHELSSYSS